MNLILGMALPTQGTGQARSRPMAWPRLYQELKAAGRAQGVKEQPVQDPQRAPHLHRTLHTITTGRLSSGCPHIPPDQGAEEKGTHLGSSSTISAQPTKARTKGVQEQL